jgi:hypothetical protein
MWFVSLANRQFNMLEWKQGFPSLGIPCAGGRLCTTSNEEVVYS